jgi:hypothetical protein
MGVTNLTPNPSPFGEGLFFDLKKVILGKTFLEKIFFIR